MKSTVKYPSLLMVAAMLMPIGCERYNMLDECPPKMNTTIYFNLLDQEGHNVFNATVDHVDLFIYDADGRPVTPQIEKHFPDRRSLRLDPGDYTLVAWGNATPRYTRFFTNEYTHWLNSSNNYLLTAGESTDDGDPLYYAPKVKERPLTFTVPLQGEVEVTAAFRNAHVKIEVTVDGYKHLSTRTDDYLLEMELTEITSRYSFGLEAHGSMVHYMRYAHSIDSDKKLFNTSFHVPLFGQNTATVLHVTNNSGKLIVPPISIRELLGKKIEIEKLTYLPIRITFDDQLNVAITVDLPEWNESTVTPKI